MERLTRIRGPPVEHAWPMVALKTIGSTPTAATPEMATLKFENGSACC